ncbi:hypothetical protein AB4Z32_08140 [Massilia sp. 2TAF26]|uniref:hypothetical protein n=1 Tax=Massilia sp. 2TAF26 TaxID=3233012 RepID=UPI003F988D39
MRILRNLIGKIATVSALALLPASGMAAIITFTQSNTSGNHWINHYTVKAGATDTLIEEFTLYFEDVLYKNLAVVDSPSGWDSLVIQPDSAIPADGFFDSLAMNLGIGQSEALGRFSVAFDFLGVGAPGRQRFDIVAPLSFAVLSTGLTSKETDGPPPDDVPEPDNLALICVGLAILFTTLRRHFSSPQ